MGRIEWTGRTWNPATGCTKVSPGCKHCYAERMATRLKAMGARKYASGFEVVYHPDVLGMPLRTRKATLWFVNSMSDLLHEQLPPEFIREVFEVMRKADWHVFQVLTKRSARLAELAPSLPWSPNIWMGVSVESNDFLWRLEHLRRTQAAVKFISIEPLLGPLPDLDLDGIDWVIVGGESGPEARPMGEPWVLDILDRCLSRQVPFFFKQWGGVDKGKAGRHLRGATWDQMPSCGRTLLETP